MRKQLKREKVERQTSECRRVKELLQLQNMLDGLGSETARADFISGTNGAVVSREGGWGTGNGECGGGDE